MLFAFDLVGAPRMKDSELTDEPSLFSARENVRRRQSNQSEEKAEVEVELEDALRERRKREARKPLYLVRYE